MTNRSVIAPENKKSAALGTKLRSKIFQIDDVIGFWNSKRNMNKIFVRQEFQFPWRRTWNEK